VGSVADWPRCGIRGELFFESLLSWRKWPINGASELSVVKISDEENFDE
jgi:hypothetical protein